MNRNAYRYLALGLVVCAFTACNKVSESVPTPQEDGATSVDALQVNRSLDKMAKLFAQAVRDPSLRQQIHDQAAKRFDGDTDVLYQTLSASSSVRQGLARAYSRSLSVQAGDALSAVDALAKEIPHFQVAVPVKLGKWDAKAYTPLVGYMPVGVEDTTLKTITAYDAQGNAHQLDAQAEPAQPVIILGLNERTDDAGSVQKDFVASNEAPETLTTQGRYSVRLVSARVHDDKEPWPKGKAEIYLIAKGPGLWWHADVRELDNSGDRTSYIRKLGDTTGGVYFYWYEDDGASLDVTVSVKGVSLGIKIDDDDDFMGSTYLSNGYFSGGSNNSRDLGAITQVTD